MTSANNVANALARAYQPFAEKDVSGLTDGQSDSELPYTLLGDLARSLVDKAEAGDTNRFAEFFREFDATLARASDGDTRNLLISGFLEDLQNLSINRGIPMDQWTPWLGNNTQEAWQVVQKLWNGAISPAEFNAYVAGAPTAEFGKPTHPDL